MHTSLARRLSIAATTLAMVAIGTGTAGAQPPPHAAASSDGPGGGSGNAAGKASSGPADRFWVDTLVDTVDADIGDGQCEDADGDCSLRAAVQEANAAGERVRIRLDKGATYVLDRSGAGEDFAATGDLDVTGDVVVKGDATIDATGLGDRLFDVAGDAALALDGPDLVGGTPPSGESGGAIRSAGTTDLKKADVSDSVAEGPGASGGAVFNAGGHLAIKNSTLSANHASRAGGAIEANAGTTELKNVELVDNSTGAMPGNGGGLHLTGAGVVDVRDSMVSGNTAAAEGGGLWNSGSGTMTVTDTHLVGNTASGDLADNGGGALFNDGGTLTVWRSTIADNAADGSAGSGGGILNDSGWLVVTDTSITDNTSNRAGGGIEAVAGTTDLDRVDLSGNSTGAAPGNGGGLHLTGAGTVDITDSLVVTNTAAAEGGGLWNSATGTMTVGDTTISGNQAPVGPDVFNDGGVFTVDGAPVPVGG